MVFQYLEFCKNYLKNANIKIKLALTRMAKKNLTPPPASIEVERLFSAAGDILSNKRKELFQKIWKNFFFVKKFFQSDSVINHYY